MSETKLRIISGLAITSVYGLMFNLHILSYGFLFIFIYAVSFIVLEEFYSLFLDKKEDKVNKIMGHICSFFIVGYFYIGSLRIYSLHRKVSPDFLHSIFEYFAQRPPSLSGILLICIFSLGIYNIAVARLNQGVNSLGIIIFGLLYIPLSISHILLLRGMYYGVFYIWLVSWIAAMTDVWGYICGKLFGRHKLPLSVSPNKTWEGYIGSFVMQMLLTILFYEVVKRFFDVPVYSIAQLMCISVIIFITSVFGDLFESLIKRNAHAKDSGKFLPGHGGLLDRIDSIMFSLPAFYCILHYID